MMHKILSLVFFLSITLSVVAGQAVAKEAKVTIATMNLQKVIAISKVGLAAKNAVTQKFDGYQKEISKEEKSLLSLKDEIEKKGSAWSDKVRIQKEREYTRRVQDLQEDSQLASKEMKSFENEKVGPILDELEKIIEEFGKKKGYTLILDTSKGVLYQDESIDISKELAAELDKRHPEIK